MRLRYLHITTICGHQLGDSLEDATQCNTVYNIHGEWGERAERKKKRCFKGSYRKENKEKENNIALTENTFSS